MGAVLNLLLWGTAIVCTLMVALWFAQRRTGNAGIVDAGWAAGIAALAILYAAHSNATAHRTALAAGMAAVWGARLAAHLLRRVMNGPEDGRYADLRRQWGTGAQRHLFFFFQVQALACVVLSVPFLIPMFNSSPGLSFAEYAGVGLWFAGMAGEWLADLQLRRFKSDPANRGKVCSTGLWRYSRHPNYFFEWVIWTGFSVFALGSPFGYAALYAPFLILYFLLRATGVPPAEAQALRTKGDAYRRYQRTTSRFLPWFPRDERA
jgi:steroid 5-alpha reductase family enzyme